MKRLFRSVLWGSLLLVAMACEQSNATFGSMPQVVCEAVEEMSLRGHQPDRAACDRIYRKLLPQFAELRGRKVPYVVQTGDYQVLEVTLGTLLRTCDLNAAVTVKPAERFIGVEKFRLHFLLLGGENRCFARGIVPVSRTDGSDCWHGEAILHLLLDAARYRDFERMVFVTRERFHAAAEEIREYGRERRES